METEYPTIVRRYAAALIDGLFVLALLLCIALMFQGSDDLIVRVRV